MLIAENPQTAAFAKASKVDIDEDEKPSFSDGEEEESQPIPLDESSHDQDDESDDEQQVSTFSETLAAMKVWTDQYDTTCNICHSNLQTHLYFSNRQSTKR